MFKNEEREPTIPPITRTRKSQPKTLKLKGIVKNINITIVVDSGSTHNYIDINVARQLNLFVHPTKDLTVAITNGQKVKGVVRCHKVSVHIQELELQTIFYALPFDEMVMVPSAEWKMQLGTYTTNLKEQFMEFNWQDQHYKLYGNEDSALKNGELQPRTKAQEAQMNIQHQKQGSMLQRSIKDLRQTTR
jgi:hypothetical protein